VIERVPLLIEATPYNSDYLATKVQKLGHLMVQTYLVTIALHWQDQPKTVTERYDRLEKLRYLVKAHNFLVQEETRPVAVALFGKPHLIVHLGLEEELVGDPNWFHQPDHAYVVAIAQIINHLASLPYIHHLEFLVSPGSDPLTGLQIQIDRQHISRDQLSSTIGCNLQPQVIYSIGTTGT